MPLKLRDSLLEAVDAGLQMWTPHLEVLGQGLDRSLHRVRS
jgi:hypothetical protein